MTRRITAILLALVMLLLNVGRADAACASHQHEAAASHAGMQHDAEVPAGDTPCETPEVPDCCEALASCAPVLSIDETSPPGTSVGTIRGTIASAVLEGPLSRSTPPEPPPPKP